ncbi:MAG TPA: hypothetical protein VGR11_05090 [Solirubrobacteraceae bacterium]|nr:hypothetical protein [Solirubrobacteraceae bacterium]
MSTADQTQHGDFAAAAGSIPDQELDKIIFRAAAIGIPAWRVITALGLPLSARTSGDGVPPAR